MTQEVEVSDDSEPAEIEGEILEADDLTYFVSGPSCGFIVQGKQYIKPMTIAACMINGDPEEAYTHQQVKSVAVVPQQPSVHLMTRRHNTTLH
jgi:hypothetical protein